MPYFFILPAYVLLLVGLVAMAVAARFIPRFKPASGYIIGGSIGTLIGIIIANLILVAVGVAPAWLSQKYTFPEGVQRVISFFTLVALLIGPFIASAIGVGLGFITGLYCVYRRRKRPA